MWIVKDVDLMSNNTAYVILIFIFFGWDFIFDSATNGLIYKAGPDATAAVKKELGI
jgi:hypothetical protein